MINCQFWSLVLVFLFTMILSIFDGNWFRIKYIRYDDHERDPMIIFVLKNPSGFWATASLGWVRILKAIGKCRDSDESSRLKNSKRYLTRFSKTAKF